MYGRPTSARRQIGAAVAAQRIRHRADEGFTLVELLVVMIIIGILAAIAVPSFVSQKNKAYETAMKADIQQIRLEIETHVMDDEAVGLRPGDRPHTAVVETAGGDVVIPLSSGNNLTNDSRTEGFDYCIEVTRGSGSSELTMAYATGKVSNAWGGATDGIVKGNCLRIAP
jgi:prepilin-type N-terminal cleavage/methylation domain-containing protein